MDDGVELRDVISQLRTDLAAAMTDGAGEALRFETGPIELEVTIGVQKAAEAGAKARFWVMEANANAKWAATSTQRLKLTLTPRTHDAPMEAALISGREMDGER